MADAAAVIQATGKRKTAIARVRLKPGTGQILVNGRTAEEYFPRGALQISLREPFDAVNTPGRFDVIANVTGGGLAGQVGALRHGIARALQKFDVNWHLALKQGGYLTRDARKKERKKYGQRGARARYQFSKR